MMKTKINVIAFLLALNLMGCKKEQPFNDYQYSDKGMVINCENMDTKLYNEALYTFENDILKFYGTDRPNQLRAYSQFVREAVYNRAKYVDILSPHTVNVFQALKKDNTLWDANQPKSHLNYNSPFFKCIADNIQSNDLKVTLNALVSTKSMSPKLFGTPLTSQYSLAIKDKYLATYIAFDLFYAKLFDVDLSQINMDKPKEAVDFNKVPKDINPDMHAGHNH
ncbi:hypothetical protein [Aestuariivivens sediminis]|uniref:hypothetical protein n=1 Tax=Aestuariivivens sediminis TaxID=2913557 RepID=UPI001F55BA6A|nr:hypothetical protein [Aestuariivivens sediminis]